jgi:hypothetical protein
MPLRSRRALRPSTGSESKLSWCRRAQALASAASSRASASKRLDDARAQRVLSWRDFLDVRGKFTG